VNQVVGHFRLDEESKAFFGSPVIHLIRRGDAIIGRFGRRGIISGLMLGPILEARWKKRDRNGWLRVTFDPSFRSFSGDYGLTLDAPALGRCRASTASNGRPSEGQAIIKKVSET
jgi:hypothetical protein